MKNPNFYTAKSVDEAWAIVNSVFPYDYEYSPLCSNGAGYPVYEATASGVSAWISDLCVRLEMNIPVYGKSGKLLRIDSINIWIEQPEPEPIADEDEAEAAAAEPEQPAEIEYEVLFKIETADGPVTFTRYPSGKTEREAWAAANDIAKCAGAYIVSMLPVKAEPETETAAEPEAEAIAEQPAEQPTEAEPEQQPEGRYYITSYAMKSQVFDETYYTSRIYYSADAENVKAAAQQYAARYGYTLETVSEISAAEAESYEKRGMNVTPLPYAVKEPEPIAEPEAEAEAEAEAAEKWAEAAADEIDAAFSEAVFEEFEQEQRNEAERLRREINAGIAEYFASAGCRRSSSGKKPAAAPAPLPEYEIDELLRAADDFLYHVDDKCHPHIFSAIAAEETRRNVYGLFRAAREYLIKTGRSGSALMKKYNLAEA